MERMASGTMGKLALFVLVLAALLRVTLARDLEQGRAKILARFRTKARTSLKVVEMPASYPIGILADARVLVAGKFGPMEEEGSAPIMFYSIFRQHQIFTGLYWDVMATLPSYVPEGPIAVLGLGAGTFVRIIHAVHPERMIKAWDVEPDVVEAGRKYLGLKQVEDHGKLKVFIEDALSGTASKEGPYAGIIVDMFHGDKVLAQLRKVETWQMFKTWLKADGRIMLNLGWETNPELRECWMAVRQAFDGDVLVNHYNFRESRQSIGLTGPLKDFPDLAPGQLKNVSNGWQKCTNEEEPCYPPNWR